MHQRSPDRTKQQQEGMVNETQVFAIWILPLDSLAESISPYSFDAMSDSFTVRDNFLIANSRFNAML